MVTSIKREKERGEDREAQYHESFTPVSSIEREGEEVRIGKNSTSIHYLLYPVSKAQRLYKSLNDEWCYLNGESTLLS